MLAWANSVTSEQRKNRVILENIERIDKRRTTLEGSDRHVT